MLKDNIAKMINDQLNYELYSAYIYYSMSSYADSKGLKGIAHWLKIQALEESAHAEKFSRYLNDRGSRVELQAIPAPRRDWNDLEEMFNEALHHEYSVSERVSNITHTAFEERDHATYNFMQWFVGEQVEEEATFTEVLDKMKLVAKSAEGTFILDKDMGTRVLALPLGVSIAPV